MPVSEEKIEETLKAMKEATEQMKRVQAENSKIIAENAELQKSIITLLKGKPDLKNLEEMNDGIAEGDMGDKHSMNNPSDNMTENEIGVNPGMNRSFTFENGYPNMSYRSRPFKAKPTRPTIETEVDDLGWQIFVDAWARYKKMSELINEEETCLELRECCSVEVNKLLYEFTGKDNLNSSKLTEEKLLDYIKSVAVKTIHTEVHRWHFNQKCQEDGETVTRYVGRLKAQAALCKYTVKCECNRTVSYAEEIISQRLVAGLANLEHQSKVLSEAQDLTDLKLKISRLVSLETTDDVTSEIWNTTTPIKAASSSVAAARSSQYKRGKRNHNPETKYKPAPFPKKDEKKRRKLRCRGCGRSSHGEGKSMNREECPAFGKECLVCHKKNHFAKVCDKQESQSNYVRMAGDTTSSETSDGGSCSDSEYLTTDEEPFTRHFAVNSSDFRWGRQRGSLA